MLGREEATFERLKPQLLIDHPGKYALISGDTHLGTYDTEWEAHNAGYRLAGVHAPFLVGHIVEEEPVHKLGAPLRLIDVEK